MPGLKLQQVNYDKLNSRQQEIYNFQKLAAVLVDYGFNCIKLSDDWQGADFLADHKDGQQTLRVQLKARLTISKKYIGKNLFIAFPVGHVFKRTWYLVAHDELVNLLKKNTPYLDSKSWQKPNGEYSLSTHSPKLLDKLTPFKLSS